MQKGQIFISPGCGSFQFLARVERYVYLKNVTYGGEFHLAYL